MKKYKWPCCQGLARHDITCSKYGQLKVDEIVGDDGDREILCDHGVGHSYEVHTCDGCCFGDAHFAAKMLRTFGPHKDKDAQT
jgi:hypothetical protein